MTLRSIMLQLREDQIERLDARAAKEGLSRSKLIRDAVDSSLSPSLRPDVSELYAAAYPSRSWGTDEWGDLDEWHAAAAAERTTVGRDPW